MTDKEELKHEIASHDAIHAILQEKHKMHYTQILSFSLTWREDK